MDGTRLRVHRRIHLGYRPFACPHCDKAFTQRRTLDEHARTHLDREQTALRCPHCPERRFVQANHLKTHLAAAHGEGDRLSRCDK